MKRLALLSTLALALAACGSSTPGMGGPTGDANLGAGPIPLSGRITNYKPSDGAVIAAYYKGYTKATTGTVDSNGNFSITLPVPASTDYTPAGNVADCSNIPAALISRNVTSSNAAAGIVVPKLSLSNYGTPQVLLTTSLTAGSGSLTLYVYANADTDVTGSASCATSDTGRATVNVNLHFKTGWNLVSVGVTGNITNGQISYRTVSAPEGGSSWTSATTFSGLSKTTWPALIGL